MTTYLFSAWISHFIQSVERLGHISLEKQYFLIMNGHTSLVALEVVKEAKYAWLDLLMLSTHTLHTLQPLDYNIFKPFYKVKQFMLTKLFKGKSTYYEDDASSVQVGILNT